MFESASLKDDVREAVVDPYLDTYLDVSETVPPGTEIDKWG